MMTAPQDTTALLNVAALRAHFATTLLPNEILLATVPDADVTLSFSRGIPGSTEQGTAALLSERDLTREVLCQAGYTVPVFAPFLFRTDRQAALAWADQVGYPIVASPAWMVRPTSPAPDSVALTAEIDQLAQLTARRSPGPAHPRARYLLEKAAGAHRIELGIAHGEVLYRIIDEAPAGEGAVHPTLEEYARQAVAHIPGLRVGRVWLSVDQPDAARDGQVCEVSDVNPRATFNALLRADKAAAESAALRLLKLEADAQGLELTQRPLAPKAVLTVGGLALPEHAAQHVAEFCDEQLPGLTVTATPSGIVVESSGAAEEIDALQRSLMYGLLDGVRPLYVAVEWRP